MTFHGILITEVSAERTAFLMFVVSFKSSKKKLAVLAAAGVVLIGALIWAGASGIAEPAANVSGINYSASTNEERVNFISQFGWEIDTDPIEVEEVIIPTEFTDVYENYNKIQKEQKLDLEKYKGMRVKRWTYAVKNYPGYENKDDVVRADLLVYEGRVIGGDICSVELDGFMHGFEKQTQSAPTTQTAASQAAETQQTTG